MNSEQSFIRILLELGNNTVLGAVLVAFGTSAQLMPSLLTSVGTWKRISVMAIVIGIGWSFVVTVHYFRSLKAVIAGRKRERFFELAGFIVGVFAVIGTLMVASSWAANNAAMRYCTGKPDTKYAEECKRAFEIP
ncbi:MAG: hypothetical protein LBG44_05385 [Gemmatimonadota bacterium]|jgi:hypothetical protein|nr:hypothetical protein [Gemmatimonadota bacterium]